MVNLRQVFSKIYDQNINKIYRFIFLKVNSQEVTQDLTSETFLRAWQSFRDGDKIENPSAFLYRIARNLVTDYYRQKGRTQLISPEITTIADPGPGIEEMVVINSDLNRVKAGLANLNEDYQNVIIWHYLDDLPIKKIAQMLDRTEGATRVLLHRALQSLREQLNL